MAGAVLGSRVQSTKRKLSKSDISLSETSQSKRLNRVSDAETDALGAISPYDSTTGCTGSNESLISRTASNNGQFAHSLASSVLSEKDTLQDCGETEMEIIKARYKILVPNIQEGVSHTSYKISHRKPEHNHVKFTTHTYECTEKSDVPLNKNGRLVNPRLLEFIFDDRYYHIMFQKEYLQVLEATTSEALWYFCADTLPHVLERWNWYSSESVELTNWKRALYNQEVPVITISPTL
ncbi:hypothetical protein B0O99DRAFT_599366 [Bisporella sp. PMI_857]|nr:hypothetical protein B0O99DRAFT_599366 [Bisporella sp. PMI_857]